MVLFSGLDVMAEAAYVLGAGADYGLAMRVGI